MIEKLLIKMQECGIEVTEQELIEMQTGSQQEEERPQTAQTKSGLDMIVTFGAIASEKSITKQMTGAQFQNFDHLKQTLRKQFDIADEDFLIKFQTINGTTLELGGNNFEQMRELGTQ